METIELTLTEKRMSRLRAQGYIHESDEELAEMAFGIRFAYRACTALLTYALVTQSVVLFGVMLGIAFLGIVLPKHPFDYLYNYTINRWTGTLKLPERSLQLKFACMIATLWISTVIYLMATGYAIAGSVMAGVLILVALLPSTIDLCIPSVIYNFLFAHK
jgi:hypothetical protein